MARGPTSPNVQIETAGRGAFFPMSSSVAGTSGYPVATPIKEAVIPYWSSGKGVPTFDAPLGSYYTDLASTQPGQPIWYIRIAVSIGSAVGAAWHVII